MSIAVVVGLLLCAGAAWWVFAEAPEAAPSDRTLADDERELAQWGVVAEPEGTTRPAAVSDDVQSRGGQDPEREARRARWRERWRRAVDIVPLGPAATRIEPDQIREALSPGRAALRSCIEDQGGWRALRAARRAERAEGPVRTEESRADRPAEERRRRRPRRRASFDVRPDGSVDPESVEITPAMPEMFAPCFETFISSAEFSDVGADGARVEMPLGPPGGRRRRGFTGDGGVGGWRGGERRRERRALDEGSANEGVEARSSGSSSPESARGSDER